MSESGRMQGRQEEDSTASDASHAEQPAGPPTTGAEPDTLPGETPPPPPPEAAGPDATASDDFGPAVRPLVWVLSPLFALALAVLVPWFTMAAPDGLMFSKWFYVPVVPLSILSVLALVWNPLLRLFGRHVQFLAVRPRELVVLGCFLYIVAGLAGTGGAQSWRSMMMREEFFSREDDFTRPPNRRPVSIKEAFPNGIAFAARADMDAAAEHAVRLSELVVAAASEQITDTAEWDEDHLARVADLQGLDLPRRYRPSEELVAALEAVQPGIAASTAAEALGLLAAYHRELQPELRLIRGLSGRENELSGLLRSVGESERLRRLNTVSQDLQVLAAGQIDELPTADEIAHELDRPFLPPGFYKRLQEHVAAARAPPPTVLLEDLLEADRAHLSDGQTLLALRSALEKHGAAIDADALKAALGVPIEPAFLIQARRVALEAGNAGPSDEALGEVLQRWALMDAYSDTPASRLSTPVGPSIWFVLAGIAVILGFVAFTARQWTHHERLQHPLVQVPLALSRKSFLSNRAFQLTVAVLVLFWLYQYGATNGWHPLPSFATDPMVESREIYKGFGIPANVPGRWAFQNFFGKFNVVPFAIGIAFLLSADIGFSVWGGFWFGALISGWLFAFGLQFNFANDGRLVGAGAGFGLVALVFWLGRHHYWRLLRAAVLAGPDPHDPVGVWGARALLIGGLASVILIASYVGGPWYYGLLAGLLGLAFFLTTIVVIARVVAESGLAAFQAPEVMNKVVNGLGLPFIFPIQAILMTNWLSRVLAQDTRENLAGFAVQTSAMSESSGLRQGRTMLLLGGFAVVVVVATVFSELLANWVMQSDVGTGKIVASVFGKVFEPDVLGMTNQQVYILVGFLLIFAVAWLRRVWNKCPIHPLGLVVAVSWPIYTIWASLMLGWAAKVLVLRFGGAGLYSRLKPVAIAFILGDMLGFGLQALLQVYSHQTGMQWEVWRTWP